LVTDLEKKRQALAVTLCLKGQAKAKALELKVEDLNTENGMDSLITELDKVFLWDKVDLSYTAYSDFDRYRKASKIGMADFIIEFERRYNLCVKYDMKMPDAVLSFKLLESAYLSDKERQLALTAATDLKFESMKSALKRIFGSSGARDLTLASLNENGFASGTAIKQEPVYYTKQMSHSHRKPMDRKGTNPVNRFGKVTRCRICNSIFHWAKDCGHREQKSENVKVTDTDEENCNIVLFARESPQEVLITESQGAALIDTACTRTVCGKAWLDNYISTLNDGDKERVEIKPSERNFRFGDGKQVKSYQNVVIPAKIGNTECRIDTEVVDVDLPLLLSKTSLKKAKTVLDLSNDKAVMFDEPVKLEYTSSGHYIVNITKPCKLSYQ